MSQQGNMTPGRSDNGAVTMPNAQFEIANYHGRNGFMDYPVGLFIIFVTPGVSQSAANHLALKINILLSLCT